MQRKRRGVGRVLLTVRGEFLVLHSLPGILADAGQQVIPVQVRLLHNARMISAPSRNSSAPARALQRLADDGC